MAHRGRPPVRLTLDAEVRAELERRIRAFTSTQREARRARIILACEQCGSAQAAARVVGVHPTTVERWRTRFLKKGLRGLEDRARPGHKPKFTPVQRLEIIAAACEPVIPLAKKPKDEKPKDEKPKDGKTTRTIAQLVDEVQRRGIVSSIGWSTVQRLLADLDVKPHKTEQWLHSTDPEFREKVTAICDLYLTQPALNTVVLCIDEKPGMQALERRFPDRPTAPGRLRRREFEYKRHGTQTLLCAFNVHTGKVLGDCGDTRKAPDLVRFMERIATEHPHQTVHVIWDCLNIHFDGKDGRWTAFNERHGNRFVFHYTPKHASWVNQVECFFSILQRQCLTHGSFGSVEELREAVLAFLDDWNRNQAHPFRWTFTGYPLQTGEKLAQAA
ncbi:MAG TPA: IS630 family transposase [Acidimicrobiales bacterium]